MNYDVTFFYTPQLSLGNHKNIDHWFEWNAYVFSKVFKLQMKITKECTKLMFIPLLCHISGSFTNVTWERKTKAKHVKNWNQSH